MTNRRRRHRCLLLGAWIAHAKKRRSSRRGAGAAAPYIFETAEYACSENARLHEGGGGGGEGYCTAVAP